MAANPATILAPPKSPRLPNAPRVYEAHYIDNLTNILRLYFNELDNLLGPLSASGSVYTVATLPSAVTFGKGTRTFVSDALAPTFGSTVAGGGAVATPVYSDGTNWKVG